MEEEEEWGRRSGRGEEGEERDQFVLMLTAQCFNDPKHCISLHAVSSSLSATKQVRYRN